MMNAVALFLVLSSLVTAGLWSPPPQEKHTNPITQEGVIAKNGHQKLIVEFDKEDGHTKVSISPQETAEAKCYDPTAEDELSMATRKGTAAVEDSKKQKVEGALDKCREKAREVEERAKDAAFEDLSRARESVEHKTGDVSNKAFEVKDGPRDVIREASEKAREVREAVGDVAERAKERVSEKAREAKEAVGDLAQKAKEKVSEEALEAKEKASEKAEEAKERVSEKAQEAKDAVGDVTRRAKETVSDVTQKAKENVLEKAQEVKERVCEKAENVQEGAEEMAGTANNVAEEGEKDLNEILWRGRELGYDVLVFVVSPKAVEPAARVAHLLGFAAAFGVCLWVTFVSSYVLAGALNRQQFGVVQSKIYPVYFRTMAYCVALALLAHLLSHGKRMMANYMGFEVFLAYNLLASLVMILFNFLYLEPRATKVMFERMKLEKEEGRGRESSISEPISNAPADPTAESAGIPVRGVDAISTTPFSKEGQGKYSSISEARSKSAADPTADSAAMPAHGAEATQASPRRPEGLEQVSARAQIVELSERLKKLNAYSSLLNMLTLMLLTWHLVYLGQHLHVAC